MPQETKIAQLILYSYKERTMEEYLEVYIATMPHHHHLSTTNTTTTPTY